MNSASQLNAYEEPSFRITKSVQKHPKCLVPVKDHESGKFVDCGFLRLSVTGIRAHIKIRINNHYVLIAKSQIRWTLLNKKLGRPLLKDRKLKFTVFEKNDSLK